MNEYMETGKHRARLIANNFFCFLLNIVIAVYDVF